MAGIISNSLMYSYYGSAPTTRKTSINSTMQLMALFNNFACGRFIIYSFFIHILPGPTKQLFTAYPNFMCSLTSDRYFFYLFYATMNSVFVLRCGMKLRPLHFVDLNHEIIQKVVISVCAFFVIFELSFSLIKYQTFCPISYISVLNVLYDFNLDTSLIPYRHSTPLLKIMGIIGFCAEMTPIVVKKWKKWRSPSNFYVPPTYTINLPTISTTVSEVPPPNPVSMPNINTNHRIVSAITPVEVAVQQSRTNLDSIESVILQQTPKALNKGIIISVTSSQLNNPNTITSTQLNILRGNTNCNENSNASNIAQSDRLSLLPHLNCAVEPSSTKLNQRLLITERARTDTTNNVRRTVHPTPNFSAMACLVPPG